MNEYKRPDVIIEELKQRNAALKDALMFIADEQIKKAENRKKYYGEPKQELTKEEYFAIQDRDIDKWKTAKKNWDLK